MAEEDNVITPEEFGDLEKEEKQRERKKDSNFLAEGKKINPD